MSSTRFRIDVDRGLVIAAGEGIIGTPHLLEAGTAMSNHPNYRPEFDTLWDFRDARFITELDEIVQLTERISQLKIRETEHRVAFIVLHAVTRQLTELFPRVGPDHPVAYKSFFDDAEALRWLEQPEDLVLWPEDDGSPAS